mmetsp:Transcript_59492/g.117900  ORF Transcript_59492/g.117900 Transcript_59492/m.117900 type:complete len:119 (+) Transcript_59492:593-949(+)
MLASTKGYNTPTKLRVALMFLMPSIGSLFLPSLTSSPTTNDLVSTALNSCNCFRKRRSLEDESLLRDTSGAHAERPAEHQKKRPCPHTLLVLLSVVVGLAPEATLIGGHGRGALLATS